MANKYEKLSDDEKRALIIEKRMNRLEKMMNEDLEREHENNESPKKRSLVERFRNR
jgi:hypothetical protein